MIRNCTLKDGVRSPQWIAKLGRLGMSALLLWLVATGQATAGVWTQLTTQSPTNDAGTMLLLTDGTVMVQGHNDQATKRWDRLSPDSSGNYINGTWSSMASMGLERLFFGSNVLPSGKVLVVGGEYSGPLTTQNLTNTGEIYDPLANTWTAIPDFPLPQFGDDPTILLPTGKVLAGYIFDSRTFLYDPATNSWSQTGSKLRGDRSDEETWVMLPDGSILSYDVFASPPAGTGSAQRYIPSSATWVDAGSVPVPLTGNAFGFELGPATLLPDGRLFQTGANNNTVLYTPAANTWAAGPTLPASMGCDDAPGVMLPNGHFLFVADTSSPLFNPPSKIYDFNWNNNSLTDVTPGGALGTRLAGLPAFVSRFLVLPNGHILFSAGGQLWDYDSSPDGGPQAAWRPSISSIAKVTATTYTLSGKQLTGLWQGASFGDDVEMDTNYPIVRMTDINGTVKYARTTNWTPGVATGVANNSVQFTLPTGFTSGTFDLVVIANGIPSNTQKFSPSGGSIPQNDIVQTSWNPANRTLTLIGDPGNNTITATWRGDRIVLTSSGSTRIQVGSTLSTSSTIVTNTGNVNISGDFGAGNDSLTIASMPITTLNPRMGDGNDKVVVSYCTITTSAVDGGNGTDTFTNISSTITTNSNVNIP